jgi:hypothetical protein
MKNLLSLLIAGLMAVSSIALSGCCSSAQNHGNKHGHEHSKMHHEHGDK